MHCWHTKYKNAIQTPLPFGMDRSIGWTCEAILYRVVTRTIGSQIHIQIQLGQWKNLQEATLKTQQVKMTQLVCYMQWQEVGKERMSHSQTYD